MSRIILRKMRGRVVPITVDEEHASDTWFMNIKQHQNIKFQRVNLIQLHPSSSRMPLAKMWQGCSYYENSYGSRVLFDT